MVSLNIFFTGTSLRGNGMKQKEEKKFLSTRKANLGGAVARICDVNSLWIILFRISRCKRTLEPNSRKTENLSMTVLK